MLARGDTFGAYRIVARLKAGGMAQLYLARREGAAGFTRPVALKVIHPHLAREDEFVRKFVDEATLSSKIHDPNVVHVEDLGHANGALFLAMEYVHGAALGAVFKAARTAERRLAPALVAHVAAQIASGLHAAHETADEQGVPLGIVHRDVSPQNVLIAFKGHVKVIDFGIAKALGRAQQTNPSGVIAGKIAYMPPEQARGLPVDRRADVYALGILAWELLAGRRLFEAENDIALITRVRDPRIEPPSVHAPDLPRALDDIVMAMLARDAKDRPSTALEVKRLLLDAVPEARAVEAHDVAALLRALLPDQIAAQDKQLASFDAPGPSTARAPEVGERAAERDPETTELTTTERIVEPAEALQMLTVPAVVLPYPLPEASPASAQPARAPVPMIPMTLAIGGLLALVLLVIALVVRRSGPVEDANVAPPPAEEQAPALPAADTVGARPTAPEASAAALAPSASASSVLPARASAERARPSPPRKPPRPTAPPTPPPAKSRCRIVGGVELCE